MAKPPERSEVWLVDLGMVAKVRPALVISIPSNGVNERRLTTIVPHTTSVRGSNFEVISDVRFLKSGAFDTQNLMTIPTVKTIRRLGRLPDDQMASVEKTLKRWLGLRS